MSEGVTLGTRFIDGVFEHVMLRKQAVMLSLWIDIASIASCITIERLSNANLHYSNWI